MKNFIFVIFILSSSISLFAGNPGVSAMDCVSARTTYSDNSNLKFKNKCNSKVFIFWCGELENTSKMCGEGKNNTFYTHSTNLSPFEDHRVELKPHGKYKYAVCKGTSGFETNDITHDKKDNGAFTCNATGDYAKTNIVTTKKSDSLQRWNVAVQKIDGEWDGQIVLLKNDGEAFFVYADDKYYAAKWYRIASRVSVNVFMNTKQTRDNTPAFTLSMDLKDSHFTGEIIMHSTKQSFPTKGYKK